MSDTLALVLHQAEPYNFDTRKTKLIRALAFVAVVAFAAVGATEASAHCPGEGDKPSEPTTYCPGDGEKPTEPTTFCPGDGDKPSEPTT